MNAIDFSWIVHHVYIDGCAAANMTSRSSALEQSQQYSA